MKAFKAAVTLPLAALGLAVLMAAETLALARCTVLDPDFYGKNGSAAYELAGTVAVRMIADAVLERAPASALRTTGRKEAYALAMKAFPPGRIASMLSASGPEIARFLLKGGDVPVLRSSAAFTRGVEAVVRSLLLEGLWDMLPEKPALPAFMPFTPEWNLVYGESLNRSLWLVRFYLNMADQALWFLLSALTILAGVLYLLWIRERKPFFAVCGYVLTVNGLMLCALAAAAAYGSRPIADAATAFYPVRQAAGLFAGEYPELARAVLLPFRQVFALAAGISLSFGVTMFTMGIAPRRNTVIPHVKNTRLRIRTNHVPKHARRV